MCTSLTMQNAPNENFFFTDFGINEQNYGFKSRNLVKTRHNFTWKVMYMYAIFKRGMKIYIKKKKSIYIRQFKNKFCLNKSLCAMIIRILQGISIILNLFSFSNDLWKINTCIWLRLNSFKHPSNDQNPLLHIYQVTLTDSNFINMADSSFF